MQSFSITDIGMRRKMNQDFVSATDESVGRLPNLYLLADGMGGHKAGDFASRFTVRETLRLAAANRESDIHGILEEAIHGVNHSLYTTASMRDDLRGCGTTVVAACVESGGMLCTANVGDSRLYVSGKGGLRQITIDHSLVEEMILAGSLDAKKARSHPDKNVITRAVGAEEDVDIDFFNTQLEQGDLVLMCSDGLTNMVEDEEIQRILLENGTLESKARKLIMTANLNGGLDNVSVILMDPFA